MIINVVLTQSQHLLRLRRTTDLMRRYLDEKLSRGDDSEINLKTWFGSDEDAKMLYEENYAFLDRDMDENKNIRILGVLICARSSGMLR